jgi:cytochrome c peroxidase
MKVHSALPFTAAVLAILAVAAHLIATPRPAPTYTLTAREDLGRLLFWDPILSGPRNVACATCHHPDFAYADGRELPLGPGGSGLGPARVDVSQGTFAPVRRNTPTILNARFNGVDERGGGRRRQRPILPDSVLQARAPMFWDSRVRSLEAQALEPLKAFDEMRGATYDEGQAIDSVIARLQGIPEYRTLFAAAFPGTLTIDASQLAGAIAAFERTIAGKNSAFDRFLAGDSTALTIEQLRGMDAFEDSGCDECHERNSMFSDFELRTIGVAESAHVAVADEGAGRFRFRTPSLRNVALTAPYMHNGTLKTLEDVLTFYDEGRSRNPGIASNGRRGQNAGITVDNDFRRVDDMSDPEMQDIIAFLQALSDSDFDRTIPERVPSGLEVGGDIGSR